MHYINIHKDSVTFQGTKAVDNKYKIYICTLKIKETVFCIISYGHRKGILLFEVQVILIVIDIDLSLVNPANQPEISKVGLEHPC